MGRLAGDCTVGAANVPELLRRPLIGVYILMVVFEESCTTARPAYMGTRPLIYYKDSRIGHITHHLDGLK